MSSLAILDGNGNPQNLSTTTIAGVQYYNIMPVSPLGSPISNVNPIFVRTETGFATYSYQSATFTPAATPTDVLTLTGSATTIVRVTRFWMSGLATTAGQLNPLLIRRSAANTGGTSTAPTPPKADSNDVVATAALALYSANPATLGASVATVFFGRCFLNLVTAQPDRFVMDWSTRNDKAITLRGATDILAINFAGAAVPSGGQIELGIEWTESSI